MPDDYYSFITPSRQETWHIADIDAFPLSRKTPARLTTTRPSLSHWQRADEGEKRWFRYFCLISLPYFDAAPVRWCRRADRLLIVWHYIIALAVILQYFSDEWYLAVHFTTIIYEPRTSPSRHAVTPLYSDMRCCIRSTHWKYIFTVTIISARCVHYADIMLDSTTQHTACRRVTPAGTAQPPVKRAYCLPRHSL